MRNNTEQLQLITGLGNPGAEYVNTRHNVGFMVIERLAALLPGAFESQSGFASRYYQGRFRGRRLLLQQPQTFMNLSGRAIRAMAQNFRIVPGSILVIYDDMDLEVGKLRIRMGGSAGGHHGVESAIEELKSSDFVRLRIGIGHGSRSGADHVLTSFSQEEAPVMARTLDAAAEAVAVMLGAGVAVAMNRFNGVNFAVESEENE